MTPRNIIVPVLVLGLAGVGLYAAPCLLGPCEDEASVAASDEADAPCDTPCEPPCDGDKAKAHAAGEDEPCAFAEKAKAEAALAAVEEEEPCPHALGKQQGEAQLAAQAKDHDEAAPVVDGDGSPQT